MALQLLVATGLATACTSGSTIKDDAGPLADGGNDGGVPDAGTDAGLMTDGGPDAGPVVWLSDTLLSIDAGVRIEAVSYLSGSLAIHGVVCRPNDDLPHPLVMSNHGGFQGIGSAMGDYFCWAMAAQGYVVGESSYRGEDGSDGQVEVCLGEVDDVRAMMAVLKAQSYVDPRRVAAIGGSHGGCITLQLAIAEPTLRAVVDFYGPSDLAALYAFWQNELTQGEPPPCPPDAGATCEIVQTSLSDTVRTAAGGTPAQVPQAYTARSPIVGLGSVALPLFIAHGTDDYFVDLDQTCAKRSALTDAGRAPAAWYFDTDLHPQDSALCGGGFRTSDPPVSGIPGAWAQSDRYLLVFAGQGHGFDGAASDYVGLAAFSFLVDHLQ
jgi:acetyl esterase/lipase